MTWSLSGVGNGDSGAGTFTETGGVITGIAGTITVDTLGTFTITGLETAGSYGGNDNAFTGAPAGGGQGVVGGPKGRLEFHQYNSSRAFDFARNGVDDVFFLTASEMKEEDLTGKVPATATATSRPGSAPPSSISSAWAIRKRSN